TNGYTVPNPTAQGGVVSAALRRSGVDPRAVSYVEAHGTGTKLGDPIEIRGLSKAFEGVGERGYCAIGSVKSNIGHAEGAAGIAGLTKILLQMRHGTLAPSLHADALNPYIDFDATPFRVQRDVAPWNRPVADVEGTRTELPRVAALSSFGAGGSNAHLVIQEHPKEDRPVGPAGGSGPEPVAVVLSAKSEAELRRSAELLVEELRGGRHTAADLPGIARTLQVGREAMACRLAFLTTGLDHAADTLAAYLEGTVGDSVVTGRAHGDAGPDSADPAEVERWLTEGRLSSLLRCWVEGTEIDWSRLSTAAGIPGRVSLPTYPFAEESHWLPSPVRRATRTPGHGPWLHPLVHSNTSDLSCQRFTSTFPDGDPAPSSPFLRMEMARAALLLAIASAEADAARVCLSDVAWSAPFASGGERTIR